MPNAVELSIVHARQSRGGDHGDFEKFISVKLAGARKNGVSTASTK